MTCKCSDNNCQDTNKFLEMFELLEKPKIRILILAISLIAIIISFFAASRLPFNPAWIAVILCGLPIIKNAVIGLFTRFDIKADVLVSMALIASVIIGEVFAAGEIALIMTIGMYLEERTIAKAHAGIQRLINLTPTTARLVKNGAERSIAADDAAIGDILRVLPGETIPADGVIITGNTSINQALLTGESLPVDKTTGDDVFSGTLNQFGAFDMRVSSASNNSSLARMIRLVESADANRSRIVGIADRWATVIVVAALLCAIATWFVTGEIIRAVTILVVFCPCALVLATPTAIMAAIGNAAHNGILISRGDALERMAQVKRLAFDKTGTITYGKPTVAAVVSLNTDYPAEDLVQLTATAELRSEHPLGRALVDYASTRLNLNLAEPENFEMQAGRGVSAKVNNRHILAGTTVLLESNGIILPQEVAAQAEELKDEGYTIIYVAIDGALAGMVAFSDVLREDVAHIITTVNKRGLKTTLITGDTQAAAAHMAQAAGINDVYAHCLPEHKIDVIKQFHDNQELVGMIGDGVNDAPALKTAHVGVAMGGIGSDIAVEAADIVLVGDNLNAIPHLLKLASKTMTTIHANIIMALSINFVAIILAVLGIIGPVAGALVHNLGSIMVILNSVLLLKYGNNKAKSLSFNTSHDANCTCSLCLATNKA